MGRARAAQAASLGDGEFEDESHVISFIRCECPGRTTGPTVSMALKLSELKVEPLRVKKLSGMLTKESKDSAQWGIRNIRAEMAGGQVVGHIVGNKGSEGKYEALLQVDNVDKVFKKLSDKGIDFINKPIDISGWGSRVAHFRDPEDNLIEIYSELSKDKWSSDLIVESKDY